MQQLAIDKNTNPPLFSRDGMSARFRERRSQKLRDLISLTSQNKSEIRILDIGGVQGYWNRLGLDFLHQHNVSITLVNISSSSFFKGDASGVRFDSITADACFLNMISDKEYDIAHSNSVVEHVGLWSNMKKFAGELRRVATNHYVQTPYFWFPIDPHYYGLPMFHWLPRPVRARALCTFPLATAGRLPNLDNAFSAVDNARLLDRWQFGYLFPESKIAFERIAGLPKSMVAIKGP